LSPLLTRQEAAELCRVGLRTFERSVAPYVARVRIGARVLYPRDAIENWILEHTEESPCAPKVKREPPCLRSVIPELAPTGYLPAQAGGGLVLVKPSGERAKLILARQAKRRAKAALEVERVLAESKKA
jgi:hypothetical protein